MAEVIPTSEGFVGASQLKAAMAHFATGVTVVTARDHLSQPIGSTANAVSSVSLQPPLILVSLHNESRTLEALLATGRFAVNVLHEGQEALAVRFARRGRDAWEEVSWRARAGGPPLLEGALATLECTVHDVADGGDHRIVLGRLRAVEHPASEVAPLVYYRGRYARLAPAPTPVRLPSRFGELLMQPLDLGLSGVTSAAVLVGHPHGKSGCLVYAHRGCMLGDALRAVGCSRREMLDSALDLMLAEGDGVVVYHRDERQSFGGCCLGDDAGDGTAERLAALVLERAVEQLALTRVRLLHSRDQAPSAVGAGIGEYLNLT